MTPRQRDVYLYVRYFWQKYGYGPSYLDIADGLGLKTKSNIQRIARRLIADKVLVRDKGNHRTLKPANVRIDRLI